MARKSDQIASLFASVGFKIDKKSVSDLDTSLKRIEGQLSRISKAFGSLKGNNSITKSLQNTKKDAARTATEINNLSDSFKRSMGPLQAYTQQLNATASAMRALTGAMPARLPRVPSAGGGTGVGGGVSPTRTRATAGFVSGLFGGGTTAFARGLMPGIGAGWAVMHSTQRARAMMSTELALGALTGSQAGGQAEYKYLQDFSNKYGLRATESAAGYKRILASAAGTKLEGEGARSIFEGVSLYGKTLGLTDDNMSRATTAISQMISKGKISSEELNIRLAA